MKLSGSMCEFTLFLIVAGFSDLARVADGANAFRRCYNTSVEMHCFDAQYDTTNNKWLTASFDNARQRCNNLQSTLIIIKDEENNNIVKNYLSDPYNPIINQYVWTDAYRISDYKNSYTWHWVNSKLPNLAASEVSWLCDYTCYVATLEFRSDNGKSQFYLTAKQPYLSFSYVCEYMYAAVSRCPSTGSNVLQLSDRCYIAVNASVSWYEARNRCLKDGGDLASFVNVTSINFTSWLGSVPFSRYWVGLRFTWYIWKTSGEDVKFASWTTDDWNYPCMAAYYTSDNRSYWLPTNCNIMNSIYVVCHTVTPQATTLTSTSTTPLPVTTSTSITTPTGNAQLNSTEPLSSSKEKSTSSPIALGVGVGVGVGVPVIAAIIVIVICVVRRHKSKTQGGSTTRQESGEEAFHNEYQNNNSEAAEMGHYATVRSVAPSMPQADEESNPETQYAKLGFKETADLKNGNGQSPLNVL